MRHHKAVRRAAGTLLLVSLLVTGWAATRPESATAQAAVVTSVALDPVAGGFSQPLFVTHAPDGLNRLFVLEKRGTIRVIENGRLLPTPFLDLTSVVNASGSEQGLLGLAFHPSYASNGYLYVYYTASSAPRGGTGDTTLARFRRSASNPNEADFSSGRVLLAEPDPAQAHNGGTLAFGPDGYLYISVGDGGAGDDVFRNGQNLDTIYGKILRVDVNQGDRIVEPPTNPFVGRPGDGRIWAYGLRNPYRFSFDRATGDQYIADVGQETFEEVNFQRAGTPGGVNYGWSRTEGTACFPEEATTCDRSGITFPVSEYPVERGVSNRNCSVTGGHVYRGPSYPSLSGAYILGDFCSGRIWSMRRVAGDQWSRVELADSGLRISSFGEDQAGELYVVGFSDGVVYRLRAVDTPVNCSPRPNVSMQAVPDGGRLRVTVSANPVREIRFGPTTNALLDLPGHPSGQSGSYSMTLPGGTQQTTFHVRRSAPGATTVPMTVVDACGDWKTFVGGGASAF